MVRSFIFVVAVLGLIQFHSLQAKAESGTAQGPKLKKFSLEQALGAKEFALKDLKDLQWMPDGKSFLWLAPNAETKATDIKQYTVSSLRQSVLVDSASLMLQGEAGVFSIEHFIISPNGQFLIFTGTIASRGTKSGGNLYRYDLTSQKFDILTQSKEEQHNIQISPDGKLVGFVRSNNIYVKDLTSLKEIQLTHTGSEFILNGSFDWAYEEEFGIINAWQWSPDSQSIAFWQLDQSKVPLYPILDYRTTHPVLKSMKYPKAGDSNSAAKVGVIQLLPGFSALPAVWMDLGDTSRDFYIPRLQWLPSSQELAIEKLNRNQNEIEVLIAHAQTGKARTIITEREATWIEIHDNLYFLKNKAEFLWTSEQNGFRHLYLFGLDGKLIRAVTSGLWEVANVSSVDEDSRKVFFTSNKENIYERQIYSASLDSDKIERITQEPGTHSPLFAPGAKLFVDTSSSMTRPPRIDLLQSQGKHLATLQKNELPLKEYDMGKREFFNFTTSDGMPLNGVMLKPADFDPTKKYAVILYIYGGPGSQLAVDSWSGKSYLWHHFMTQNGYIIVTVDNRGTGGRGKAFKSVTYRNLGALEAHDQTEVAKYMAAQPWVDASRIGIWGWSYGGYLTALTMCKAGSVFKAGVSVAPVTDWQYYDSIYTERYMSTPEDNPSGYRESSPITHVTGLQGSILVVHGTGDDNVHFQNSLNFVDALVAENKKVETMYYPNRTHGISEGRNTRLHLFTKLTRYFLDHL